jgi:hypothetical protein
MAFTTTRDQRAQRWRIVPSLFVAAFAFSACQFLSASGSMAQIKAPNKNHLKAPSRAAAPSEDIQPFAINANGQVTEQLAALNIDPADAQAANDAVAKALEQLDRKTTNSGRAVLQSLGAGKPKRLVALQLYSAKSLAVELHRGADGTYGFKLAPNATEDDDERVSSLPSSTETSGAGARSVVAGSVALVKVSASSGLATSLASTGASSASLKELTQALAGFQASGTKVEVWKGRTADGAPRLLAASIGEGSSRQSFWWFAPPNLPEGWHGARQPRAQGRPDRLCRLERPIDRPAPALLRDRERPVR